MFFLDRPEDGCRTPVKATAAAFDTPHKTSDELADQPGNRTGGTAGPENGYQWRKTREDHRGEKRRMPQRRGMRAKERRTMNRQRQREREQCEAARDVMGGVLREEVALLEGELLKEGERCSMRVLDFHDGREQDAASIRRLVRVNKMLENGREQACKERKEWELERKALEKRLQMREGELGVAGMDRREKAVEKREGKAAARVRDLEMQLYGAHAMAIELAEEGEGEYDLRMEVRQLRQFSREVMGEAYWEDDREMGRGEYVHLEGGEAVSKVLAMVEEGDRVCKGRGGDEDRGFSATRCGEGLWRLDYGRGTISTDFARGGGGMGLDESTTLVLFLFVSVVVSRSCWGSVVVSRAPPRRRG